MTEVAGLLRNHLSYSAWASKRLVDAAAQLTPDELNRDFGSAYHSVLGTLVHVYAADRVWFSRIKGAPRAVFVSESDHSVAVLQNDWPALDEQWQQWAAGLTEDQAQAEIAYTDLKGNPWKQPLWQIVLHVVNHATHHRGQVSAFLRALGRVPPPIDLVVFFRQSLVTSGVRQ